MPAIAELIHETSIQPSNSQSLAEFGYEVAISTNTIVAYARYTGRVHILSRQDTNWTEEAMLGPHQSGFGSDVAISGDTVVVGAPSFGSSETSEAYVFVRNGTHWLQQAILTASNADYRDWFGRAVAISGDTIAVGAQLESSSATGVNGNQNDNSGQGSGAVYVFVRNGTNWTQQAYIKSSNTLSNAQFGSSLGIDADTLVVGSRGESNFAGGTYVFIRNGTNWSQQAHLRAPNAKDNDEFGDAVAISGNTIAVSAPYETFASGAAYVFVRDGLEWTQQAYLKASNPDEGDVFGLSLAIRGDTLVVGAPQETSKATGINVDQHDDGLANAGACYVFVREQGSWSQSAYLKSSRTLNGGNFGYSVGISDDLIVTGASGEAISGAVVLFNRRGEANQLSIQRAAGMRTAVSWPTSTATYNLFSATNLSSSTAWQPVTNVFVVNGRFTTTNQLLGAPTRLFRLQGP